MGTRIAPEPSKGKNPRVGGNHFGGHLVPILGVQIRSFFLMVFKRVLFAILGGIREAMGAKVVPKDSQKGSQRESFVGRLDF